MDFPGTFVGSTSQGPPVKVTNQGQGTLTFSGVSITGPNAGDFSIVSNGCTIPISVNGNRSISASFKPTAVGYRSATLQFADNGANPHPILLRGNGNTPFTVGPSPSGSLTSTVPAGQPANYSLQLVQSDSIATVTVDLICSGAPLGTTCVAPRSVTSTNGAIAPFTVTVTTTARAGAIPPASWPAFPPLGGLLTIVSIMLGAAAVVLLAPYAAEGRIRLVGRLARYPWSYAALAVTMIAVLTIAACGGGGYSSPPTPTSAGTPAGTFTITLTATSGATTQNVPLILKVM